MKWELSGAGAELMEIHRNERKRVEIGGGKEVGEQSISGAYCITMPEERSRSTNQYVPPPCLHSLCT